MIFAVVLGHLISPFIYTYPVLKKVFFNIYLFHMPVFIMISGMLSRDEFSISNLTNLTRNLIVPFVIFTFIYEIGHLILFDETSDYLIDKIPHWLLWYLPSLFFWRLTLPFMRKIPFYLALSLLLSILIGFVADIHKFYGLSRTFYFWPFFLLGYQFTPNFIDSQLWKRIPKLVWAFLLISIFSLCWVYWEMSHKHIYGNLPYVEFKNDPIIGAFTRLIVILLSFISSLAVIGLVPRKLNIPQHWKLNTLSIYLWHGLVINILLALGLKDAFRSWDALSLGITLFFMALALTALLSTNISMVITRYITLQFNR